MVLTPILKTTISEKMNVASSKSHVTFNLPDESDIIEYLKNNESYTSFSRKLSIFIKRITDPSTEHEVLLKWIQDFKDNILFLENNERIVYTLLNLNWCAKDDKFVSTYQDFVLNTVTAHPPYLRHVLCMIIKVFCTVLDSSDEKISEVEEKYFSNGHKLLQNIIKLVPLCEPLLCKLLRERFPYRKNPTKVLFCYVQNILYLFSYFPFKRLDILEGLIEKLIDIDANCTRDKIEMAELQHEEENLLMDSSSEHLDEEKMALPLAHTLDILLNAIFQYIQKCCFSAGNDKLDWEATKKLYKELLTVFDKIILPTHGSCHIHYIMFYMCSLKQDLAEGFLDYLWKKVQNPNIGSLYRQIASFYIGSLLARAKYVNISTVMACLDLMCRWIHSYIDNHTSQDLNVHGTFHSVCQTVFYVFAFRSQELLEFDKGCKFLRTLNFDRIVTCRLNPLRYCDKNILMNFANIARNYQIVYVYPIIEKNNRNLLYSGQDNDAKSYCGAMTQMFFPFDPYLLKRSNNWIEQIYRVYSHCQKEDESMDVVDEDETNICDSVFRYSLSPGFKKSFFPER